METVYLYDSESRLLKKARCDTLRITNEKDKELIKVNGNGKTIAIPDTSIESCTVEKDGRLVIETKAGRKFVFLHNSEKGTLKLLARLNKALESSNCNLRFNEPQAEEFTRILEDSENNKSQRNASLQMPAAISALIIFIFALVVIIGSNSTNKPTVDSTSSPPVAEDSWEARLKREQEEKNKQQEKNNSPQQTAPPSQNKDAEIAAIVVTVSCAGNKGLIPRSQMGTTMKEIFRDKGIDSTQVYGNWDYYWGIAKEMDAVNKTYCLK